MKRKDALKILEAMVGDRVNRAHNLMLLEDLNPRKAKEWRGESNRILHEIEALNTAIFQLRIKP